MTFIIKGKMQDLTLLVGSLAARWLGKGPKNTSVYLGIKDVYVGITRQAINIRQAQHGLSHEVSRVRSFFLSFYFIAITAL